MSPQQLLITEAEYIDPRSGNDKFYRTFAFGSTWVSQYGRNGTVGTFTKPVSETSDDAAREAAAKKFAAKVKKGYNPTRTGELVLDEPFRLEDLTRLDDLARQLPEGDGSGTPIHHEPAQAVELNTAARPDVTSRVIDALGRHPRDTARAEDVTPPLPVRPMLASVQPESTITAAMESPAWLAQFKYDGDRVVVEVNHGQITVMNRQGQAKTRNVAHSHLEPFTALHSGRWVFDGEVVGHTLVLFDLIVATNTHLTWVREDSRFADRYAVLEALCQELDVPVAAGVGTQAAPVVLAPVVQSTTDKADYLATAVAEKREGLILRHQDGPYEPGRRSTALVKHKLIKDADVVITSLHPTKESATLSVYGADQQLREVGAASTIGKASPQVGQVWTVTFLYVTDPENPRLYQPRLIAQRDDKAADDCLLDQFADAGTSKHV